ncbi:MULTISPECIES: hypothetical protein [Flavobacterium]|nr:MULTISPECIES: hypothetical protein [Flavobacterium]
MRTLLLLFCALAVWGCYPQQHHDPKVLLAMETYAFLKGQSAALKKAASQFPAFAKEAADLQQKAQAVFGRAEKNAELFLRQQLADPQFSSFQKHIDSLINQQLQHPIEKKEYTAKFLQAVKDKIGFSPAAALPKGLLAFAYHDAPHQEIIDGHTVKFSTKGHPKADQSVVVLPIPKSWEAQEAQMPAAVQQFTSCEGKGNEKILIVIHDLPQEYQNLALNEKSMQEMIPPQSRLIRTEPVTIDDMPGIMAEIEEILDEPQKNMKVRMLQFMAASGGKLYCLQGSIGPAAAHQNLDHQLRKYEPLFRMVAQAARIEN